jgi:septum formation protein
MWTHRSSQLILASASPRRLNLLEQIAVPVKQLIIPTDGTDEPRLDNEPVVAYVQRTSQEKNQRAFDYLCQTSPLQSNQAILSADTTVAIGERILPKPTDARDAQSILETLIGIEHDVYTAVTLRSNQQIHSALVHSVVEFDQSFASVLHDYIQTGEPFGKAGAYGIQGKAAAYIKNLRGSYTNVVGLPLFETAQLLRQAGLFT